jgi:putative addiction module component (TIGR02574 family)
MPVTSERTRSVVQGGIACAGRDWCYAFAVAMSAKKIREEALRLPLTARARLAGDLLESLDGEDQGEVDAAWAAEIERRLKDGDEAYDEVSVSELATELRTTVKKARATRNPPLRAR